VLIQRSVAKVASKIIAQVGRGSQPPFDNGGFLHVHLLHTAIATDNIGDEIITQGCLDSLGEVFPSAYISTSSSHDGLGVVSRHMAEAADIVILTGTNALAPFYQVGKDFIWNVSSQDLDVLRNKVVLMGVGANRTYDRLDRRQIDFLRNILSDDYFHSVRDDLGKEICEAAGKRVLNTSCPTLWGVGDNPGVTHDSEVKQVCFTLTAHKPDPSDRIFMEILAERYERLFFFPQQPRDLSYLKKINPKITIDVVAPRLTAYDELLLREEIDVIGTRLHGTIRGLQHGKRAIVISIDNRALGLSKTTGLTVVERDQIGELRNVASSDINSELRIPSAEIETFLGQFQLRQLGGTLASNP